MQKRSDNVSAVIFTCLSSVTKLRRDGTSSSWSSSDTTAIFRDDVFILLTNSSRRLTSGADMSCSIISSVVNWSSCLDVDPVSVLAFPNCISWGSHGTGLVISMCGHVFISWSVGDLVENCILVPSAERGILRESAWMFSPLSWSYGLSQYEIPFALTWLGFMRL